MDKKTADKLAKKIVDKSPALKKLKSVQHGEKYTEIQSGDNSEEYKAGYDKIDWGKRDTTKRNYRVKVNGVYQDSDDET
jgi:hypothetical protein